MTLLAAFLLGLLVGSFLNVCIHRWPDEKSVVSPRSHCPKCSAPISWRDNIPVLSYILLRGRCRRCAAAISVRYPAVELLNGLLYLALAAKFGVDPLAAKAALFVSMMLVLVFTDIEHFILPDEITLGGIGAGLALSLVVPVEAGITRLFWLLSGVEPSPTAASFTEAAVAAVLFGALLLGVREVYYRIRRVDGLGMGDVKMAAMMASFWGAAHTLLILIVGSLTGALVGSLLVLFRGKKWNYEMPYGSYLGVAAILMTVWGDDVLGWYWSVVIGLGA